MTFVRNEAWSDNLTLFTTDAATYPTSVRLNNGAAETMLKMAVLPENEGKKDENTDKTVTEKKETGSSTLDKDEIVIGMELQFPPFETITKDGKPTGISVDMAEALGKYLGKKVRI